MGRQFLKILAASSLVPVAPCLADRSPAPRIDYVEPAAVQPQAGDPAVIWADDFDSDGSQNQYAEKDGIPSDTMPMGGMGKSLEMRYPKGLRGEGGRKLFFGDTPVYPHKAVRRGEVFQEVYWRLYVKHQAGWKGGGPDKLSRATSIATPGWAQAMIAHVWSSGESLTLDPASGVVDGQLATTRYNDFENLRWLGNRPASNFKIHSTEEAGRWVCVEARARLNTPGKSDGENQLWIDGRLEAERTGLDWRGSFTGTGINAVFLEAYWNAGSPVDQSRWIDHFVVSARPVGPVTSASEPVVVKTAPAGHGEPRPWQLELAASGGEEPVWRSLPTDGGNRLAVHGETGEFLGALEAAGTLDADTVYFSRVREQISGSSEWSDWSPWHQPFRTPQ